MPLSEYQKSRLAHIEAGRPEKKKERKPIRKVSVKKQMKIDELKASGGDSEMDIFFHSQRRFMTGRCLFCGGKTEKDNDETFFFSEAHLLPKSIFKSVATHPQILIELCFYGNSCHTNFDNGMISWETLRDSKEWDVIAEKLHAILPEVSEEERKNKLYSRLCDLLYKKQL